MLKPSLRDKKRYIIVKIYAKEKDEEINIEDIISAVWKKAYEYGGYAYVSLSNMNVIKDLYFKEKHIFVISVMPKYVEDLRFILMQVDKIKSWDVTLHVLGVSGTIKSAKEKYINKEEDI